MLFTVLPFEKVYVDIEDNSAGCCRSFRGCLTKT